MPFTLRSLAPHIVRGAGYIFPAFLSALLTSCGYTATYDGTLTLGTRRAASAALERMEDRPAILHQEGGSNATYYDWVDAKGNQCAFYLVLEGGIVGSCMLPSKDGLVSATAVTARENTIDRNSFELSITWSAAEKVDGSTLETKFVGIRR